MRAGMLVFFCAFLLGVGSAQARQFVVPEAVQLYSEDVLVDLIRHNTHLYRVQVTDDCQLYQDIRAQAEVEKRPAYQFLYGDMLAYGICYPRNIELGLLYMEKAAEQGMPEAMEQLGRYYRKGHLVQEDMKRSIVYLREAASLGNLPAQKQFAELLLAGQGSPLDMEAAYHYLHHSVTKDKGEHKHIQSLLHKLAEFLPPRIVQRAQK